MAEAECGGGSSRAGCAAAVGRSETDLPSTSFAATDGIEYDPLEDCTADADGQDSAKECHESPEESEAPDGGWGWVVTGASFVIWFVTGSPSAIFGMLFSGILIDLGTSSATIAGIHNLAFVLSSFASYLLDPLVEEYGWRKVTFAAGLMNFLGLVMSAFASSAAYLFFSYAVVAGLPIELLANVTFSIVPHYFTRRRSLANGFMFLGSSISILVMPMLITYLLNEYGFRGAALIAAALNANCCVAAMVFHPVEWHSKKPRPILPESTETEPSRENSKATGVLKSLLRVVKTSKANMSLLKSPRAIIIGAVLSLYFMGLSNFYYLIPFAMQSWGHSVEEAGLCFMVSGLCLLVTRLGYTLLVLRFRLDHQAVLVSGLLIVAVSIFVFAWTGSLAVRLLVMGTTGVGYGCFFAAYNLVMVEVLGLSLLQPMLSVAGIFNGVSFLVGGPLVGLVRDVSGSFTVCLSVLAAIMALGAALWIFMPAARAYDHRKEHQMKQEKK